MTDPALLARALLGQLGIVGVPDVREIAARLRVPIREVTVWTFEGALVRIKGQPRGIIAVSRAIREVGRRNFTIAHELAHLILPGQTESAVCATSAVESWSAREKTEEVGANRFAAELLLPASIVRDLTGGRPPSLDLAASVAYTYATSLTAATYRYVELTTFRCAVVWSARGQVRWFRASDEFGRFVRVRERIDPRSFAADCLAGREVPREPAQVEADAWLGGGGLVEGATILEESRPMPAYDGVLTLLWIRDPIERRAEDEDRGGLEPLDPADFTLARRRWPGGR